MRCWRRVSTNRPPGPEAPLRQFQKLPQVIGHLVEFRFVQRRRPRPVDRPVRTRDIGQAGAVRANDQATGLAYVDSAVLLDPQQDVTRRVEEVAVAGLPK